MNFMPLAVSFLCHVFFFNSGKEFSLFEYSFEEDQAMHMYDIF